MKPSSYWVGCNISKRELAFLNAQTLSLSGCSSPKCLRGSPPKLCKSCAFEVLRLLAYAAQHEYRRQT